MLKFNFKCLYFLLFAPYLIGWTPADSSFYEFSVGAGGGQYASYGCSGKTIHIHTFGDVGIKMIHKFEAPFRVGLNTFIVSDVGHTNAMPYPDLALDLKYFSLGTTGIRVGSENGTYGEISFLDQVPIYSGKGFLRIGVGMKATENTRFWLGLNTLPYYTRGLAGQIDFPLSTNQFIFINGRYGITAGVPEYGLSAGTRIRIFENTNDAK
jgi:hypothetical protein